MQSQFAHQLLLIPWADYYALYSARHSIAPSPAASHACLSLSEAARIGTLTTPIPQKPTTMHGSDWYLIGELVDLEGDGADGAVGGLDPGVLLALDVAALEAGGVLGKRHLGLVLDAARVQVLGVAPRPAPVAQLLVRRLQPRPRRQQLLQLPCTTNHGPSADHIHFHISHGVHRAIACIG